MNAMAVSNIEVHVMRADHSSRLHRQQSMWMTALVTSGSLGAITGVSAILIGTGSFFGLSKEIKGISSLLTVLIIIAFPMFVIAAHCLDRLDDVERSIRIEYCNATGVIGSGSESLKKIDAEIIES